MALTHRGEEPDCESRVGKLKGNKAQRNRAYRGVTPTAQGMDQKSVGPEARLHWVPHPRARPPARRVCFSEHLGIGFAGPQVLPT
jgi:hypothetical protein